MSRLPILVAIACAGSAAAAAAPRSNEAPGHCPARASAPVNRWQRTRTALLPRGARELRLCRYAPSARAERLVRQRRVRSARTIGTITRRIAELPPSSGTFACPLDDGSQVAILASYRGGHRVSVNVHLTGCEAVTNGHIVRLAADKAGSGPALIRQLRALTR